MLVQVDGELIKGSPVRCPRGSLWFLIMLQRSRRTQLFLWVAAVVVSVVPIVLGVVYTLLGAGTKGYSTGVVFSSGQCGGWLHQPDVLRVPGFEQVGSQPYLVVVPAFLIWLATGWRAAGWVAVALVGPVAAAEPVLFGYDMARWGRACADAWITPWPGWQITWWTGRLVLAALLLATVYRPGVRVVRAVSGALVIGLVLCAGGDREPVRVLIAGPEDCDKVQYVPSQGSATLVASVRQLSERERKLAYLCTARGLPGMPPSGREGLQKGAPEGVLLDLGRRACRGDEPLSPVELGRHGVHWPSFTEMAYLCPETAAARLREQERRESAFEAEYKKEQAEERAYCKRTVPKGPKAAREFTDVMYGGESSSYVVGAGDSFNRAVADGLVGGDGGSVTVLTGTEGDLCLTVRAYRKAPPLDLQGWERVVEVGFDSPDGRSAVGSMDGPTELPAVTVAGPGPYRLRVYVRGRSRPETIFPEMPAEKHLLVVFPGESKKQKVFKNGER